MISRALASLLLSLLAPLGGAAEELPLPSPLPVIEHQDEIERDYTLRSIGRLHVTNVRGSISIQGWALDKIRVKAKRRAKASTPEDAKRLLSAVDFRFEEVDGDLELAAEYGRGLKLAERVRERESPQTSMDMVVYAPARLKLSVWTTGGPASVRKWASPVEVRTTSGAIHVEEVKAESVSTLCPSCAITAKSIRGSLRCIGGSGTIDVGDVEGSSFYAESASGAVRVHRIKADQLYVSKSGAISVREARGRIEFHTTDAPVSILDSAGYLSGRTEAGDVLAKMRAWEFSDKALLESEQGNISLTLPGNFSGEIDVRSVSGKAQLGFPLEKTKRHEGLGPEPANHFTGRVGKGGELLKIFSEKGNVNLLRGAPT